MALPSVRKIPFKDGYIAYRETGEGIALFFLHGMNGSSQSWENTFKSLRSSFRLIAWDAPSFGQSDIFGDDICDYKNAAITLMHSLNMKNTVLIGHSMGGIIATQLASDKDLPVTGLILSSSHLGFAWPKGRTLMPRYANRIKQVKENGPDLKNTLARVKRSVGPDTPESIIKFLANIAQKASIESIRDGGRISQETNNRPICSTISVPVLILSGGQDKIISSEMHAEVLTAFPKAKHIEFRKAGHASYAEYPHLFNGQVKKFAKKVSACSRLP